MVRRRIPLFLVLPAGVMVCGCVGLFPPAVDGTSDSTQDGMDGALPTVTLYVSNSTPQVNEAAMFTCSVTGGGDEITFDFHPSDRLLIDYTNGRASFIVQQADGGATFQFTCTATNGTGTSEPSNVVTVTPTASVAP